jgi:hypothetical protein
VEVPKSTWLDLPLDAARLTYEASQVIGLRLALAARGGPDVHLEVTRMLSEKAQAAMDVQMVFARSFISGEGHLAAPRAVALYRDRVRANHHRLTRGA